MTARPGPDVAAIKAGLREAGSDWAPAALVGLCVRSLAAIEALEAENAKLRAPVDVRAVEAIRSFPLPSQNSESLENYRRVLAWLYNGGQQSIASLIVDLSVMPSATTPLIGEALVEAACEAFNGATWRGFNDTEKENDRQHMRAVLAIVVPAVRDAARLAINEAIIAEVNDPRNASQPTDFRDGLRVARILVNRELGESGGG